MERLLERIKGNPLLLASIKDCEKQISPVLQKFLTNFPDFTDHSIIHSKSVLSYAAYLLNARIDKLNEDEIYVLIMAGYLHDIGMCPTKNMIKEIKKGSLFKNSKKLFNEYLRNIHHELSYKFIKTNWNDLKIVNERYAEAIALVALGHRMVDLSDLERFNPNFSIKSGSDYVCLPYLSGILRLADELDITNDRTPDLLFNKYLPENKISKEEWKKHKANYLVNFKDDTIKITSSCDNKGLYYALIKQYDKIESEINNIQKLIRLIPQFERDLKLSFLRLEKDIRPNGFVPKEIGFSFDPQNTFNIFIGDNIYKNKYVAIRECLQNAIDTCRYRKVLSKDNYEPQINIVLSNRKLIVTDNGLGMDDFIVENYFSKLAKCFYQERTVIGEFEAISQFGIGVFSYFLICDYFDVESKFEGKETIKFRVNKEADSYFHFYDQISRDSTGTSITFYLRDEISIEELICHVKHYVRHVEIPISVSYKKRYERITSQDFVLDKKNDLQNRIVSLKIQNLNQLEIVTSKISTDEYDGVLGLIITKGKRGIYDPKWIGNIFKEHWNSQIELSHKGIYVRDIEDFSFRWIIGKLNLKRKKTIDIGRYHMRDSNDINSIVSDFHYEIFNKIFSNWKLLQKKSKAKLTRDFLDNYLSYTLFGDLKKFKENEFILLKENLYFTIYEKSGRKILSLKELDSLKEIIIINSNTPFIRGHDYNFEDIKDIYDYFGKPLLLEGDRNIASQILMLFRFMQKQIEIIIGKNHWHFIIKGNLNQNIHFSDEQIYAIKHMYFHDKPHIASHPNLDSNVLVNPKHKILAYYLLNKESIKGNQQSYDLFIEFFKLVHDFVFNFHVGGIKYPTDKVINMNKILININKILSTDFFLSKNDFPNWINQEINWRKLKTSKTKVY